MNKLDRFRFGNFHKRRMFGLAGIVAAVFVLGIGFLALLGIFGSRSEYVTIRLNSAVTGNVSGGIGINLDAIPSSNRISDSCFEKSNIIQTATIADCLDSYLFFDTDSGLSGRDVQIGSEIKVMSLDSDGVMSVRYSGLVNGFDDARFGLLTPISDSLGLWINDSIIDVESADGSVVAVTDSGNLLIDIASEDFVKIFEEEGRILDFVDLCVSNQVLYAATRDGIVYSSTDGRNFSLYSDFELDDSEATMIAGVNDSVLLLTNTGDVYLSGSSNTILDVPFDAVDSIIVSSGDSLLAITSDFDFYTSSNGYVFSEVDFNYSFTADYSVRDVITRNGNFYILTTSGQIITIDSSETAMITDVSSLEPQSIAAVNDENIIVVTLDGKACLVALEDGSVSDLTTNSGNVDNVFGVLDDRLIIMSGNNLNFATVLQRLQVNSDIPEDSVNGGDLCYIVSNSAEAITDDIASDGVSSSWFVSSPNTSVSSYSTTGRTVNDASCRIFGVGEGVHSISQRLEGNATDNLSYGVFYRLSLNLSAESSIDNVMVWISGTEFGDEGFTIEQVDTNEEEHSYVFAITSNSRITDEDILYVNIAFEGEGILYVDDIYLGEDKYDSNTVPTYFTESLISSNPSVIRLNNIDFGCNSASDEILYSNGINSIENSLRLVSEANSNPWFVIGSFTSAEDVDNFMGYLCGSVSSDYGKLRIDNGTAIPWARQFDTIYVEINDSDNAYLSDMQRGAYVSYVKSLFVQSSYYNDVRGRIVFLDGMNYEGGIVLSSADYHVTSGLVDLYDYQMRGLEAFDELYSDITYRIPRINAGGDNGEYIAPLSFTNISSIVEVGDIVALLSDTNTGFASIIMVDCEVSNRPVDTESEAVFANANVNSLMAAVSELGFMNNSNPLYFEVLNPLSITSEESSELFLNSCSVNFVEHEGQAYLVVSNASDSQQQFVVEGVDYTLRNHATIVRYSATGTVLGNRPYRSSDLRFTLQPGETLVVVIDEN